MFTESLTNPEAPAESARARRLRSGVKSSTARPRRSRPRLLWLAAGSVALVIFGLGIWWSQQPPKFDVVASAGQRLGGDPAAVAAGAVTVATAIQVAETLLDKPGGWLHNDMMPPGVYLTFMPNWEYGALTELRDSLRAFRNDFSRAQTQSLENEALKTADVQFNFSPESWMLPGAEQEYRKGIAALDAYLLELKNGANSGARFYTRADNLAAYLSVVEKRLGGYGQRLSASVNDAVLVAALAGGNAPASEPQPWWQVERTFYEARGYSWALLHMMKALAVDFADVLRQKNAEVSMQNVIRDLELATVRQWSPVVMNGHGFGALPNHSLVLASYIARTNAAVLDLRQVLERG